jgi:hypothetical protein
MIEMIMIVSATMLFCMAKTDRMPVFGQLTLTGEKALNWLKNGDVIIASKIWMCHPNALSDWNVPEWAKDKGVVALIFPMNEWVNPMLVTQKSVLRILEAKLAIWEEAGALCDTLKIGDGIVCEIRFEEINPTFTFSRPADCKTYDPYEVKIE